METVKGGGCLGAFGAVFAAWSAVLGSFGIMGWRSGDFNAEAMLVGGIFLGTFFFCGLGVATYRDRFIFDGRRRTITRIKRLFFVPYRYHQWSVQDFEAVEIYVHSRRRDNITSRFHVIRLLPGKGRTAPPEPLELGSGGAGREMRENAKKIAACSGLPLMERPETKQ
jgi:hypothetical protein